jgi:hypothetical protein
MTDVQISHFANYFKLLQKIKHNKLAKELLKRPKVMSKIYLND